MGRRPAHHGVDFGLSHELHRHGIAAVALAPGFMRTERVLAVHAANPFDLGGTESPEYVARAVVALAEDPEVLRKSVWGPGLALWPVGTRPAALNMPARQRLSGSSPRPPR